MSQRRRPTWTLLLALLLPLPATGQDSDPRFELDGFLGLGGRIDWGRTDSAGYEEYRDFDPGVIGSYELRFDDATGRYYLRSRGRDPGYDDQSYWLEAGEYGQFQFDFFLRELPDSFSTSARTLYRTRGDQDFVLPPGVQDRISTAPSPSAQLGTELTAARGRDLEARWREWGAGLDLRANEQLRLYGDYRRQERNDNPALRMNFGSPGGSFVAFPSHLDDETHEVKTGVELLFAESSLALEYLGSFYDNSSQRATLDNPLVASDTPTAASRGQLALAPDNSAHSIALSGASRLPTAFPSRATGSFVYGKRYQDQSFLPHTINPTIASPGLTLPQDDLDGEVTTLLGSVGLNADPLPGLDVDLRYRIYDYENDSDRLLFPEHVLNDGSLVADPRWSVPNDYTVQKAALDVGQELGERVTGHVGYAWEHWDRSSDREVESLHDHGPDLKLDFRPTDESIVQAGYSFRTRDGDSYDTFAYVDRSFDAAGQAEARDFGEYPALRKYDVADRDLHRVDLAARWMRGERLELGLSGGFETADYADSDAGLTERMGWNVGGQAFYQFHPRVGAGVFYHFEQLRDEQDSRWRPRSFFVPPPGSILAVDDPLNDWSSTTRTNYHTGGVEMRVALLPERLDLELGYQLHFGREHTRSRGPDGFVPAAPPTTGGDGGNAVSFDPIEETLQSFTAALRLRVSERLSLQLGYYFENYDLKDDFRRQDLGPFLPGSNVNGSGVVTPSTDVFLADTLDDYRVHVMWLMARLEF